MRIALTLAAGLMAASSLCVVSVQAQEAPQVAPPYYVVSVDDRSLAIASAGSVKRSGNIASITIVMGANPAQLADSGIARMDMAYQFNCSNRTYITPGAAAYDESGTFLGAIDDDQPWEAVAETSNNWTFMEIACEGIVPEDSEIDGDLNEIASQYRSWLEEQ